MSRTCRYFEDLGKLGFYEVDDESKMRLLKTHSHTSNGLARDPGKREEKQLKETQILQQGRLPINNLSRTPGVAGRAGRTGSTANKPPIRYYGKAYLVERKGNKGVNTWEKQSGQTPSANHCHGGE